MKIHKTVAAFACGHNPSAHFRHTRCSLYLLKQYTTARWARVTCNHCKRRRKIFRSAGSEFCIQCQVNPKGKPARREAGDDEN